MNSKLNPGRFVLLCLLFALPAAAQVDSNTLRAKYGAPLNRETFHMPQGFDLTVDYGAGNPVLRKVTIKTTPAQDAKAQRAIDKAIKNPPNYNLYRQNCAQFVESVLNAAGIKNVPGTIYPNTLGNGLGCKP
jgi:hypothetical protein